MATKKKKLATKAPPPTVKRTTTIIPKPKPKMLRSTTTERPPAPTVRKKRSTKASRAAAFELAEKKLSTEDTVLDLTVGPVPEAKLLPGKKTKSPEWETPRERLAKTSKT